MRLATILFVALALIPGTSRSAVQRARYLMGTVCEVAVTEAPDAEAKIEAAFAEASRIEGMLSTWREGSELSRINRGEVEPSAELRALLDQTLEWSRRTDRAFDPRIKDLIELWRIREGGPSVIASAARDLGGRAVRGSSLPSSRSLATRGITEPAGFEEGAFGKGYALDRMLPLLGDGDAMIDFGGQVIVRGELRVTIADPEDRGKPVIALTIANASLSTSSGSEKTFEIDGRRFSHILDPRTGEALPPRGSVSVLADDALTADILSTALYVMGEDDGLRWADANGVAAIFINPHRIVRRSTRARERVRDLELLDRNFRLKD